MADKITSLDDLTDGDVLIDNLTLLLANPALAATTGEFSEMPARSDTLLESIVLYDRLVLDSLLPNSDVTPTLSMPGHPSHFDLVNEALSLIPSEFIKVLDLSPSEKDGVLRSIEHVFPHQDFQWEWFLKEFRPSPEMIRNLAEDDEIDWGSAIAVLNTDSDLYIAEISHIINCMQTLSESLPEGTKWYGEHFFRTTGAVQKQVYYLALSNFIGIPYVPNYQRTLIYRAAIVARDNPELARQILDENFVTPTPDVKTAQAAILRYFQQRVIVPVDELIHSVLPWQAVASPLPPLFSRIATFAEEQNCSPLEAAIELRSSRPAVAFRKWCKRIAEAYKADDRKSLVKLLRAFVSECENWSKELGTGSPGGKISLGFFGVGIQTAIPDPIKSVQRRLSKHMVFLRDLL